MCFKSIWLISLMYFNKQILYCSMQSIKLLEDPPATKIWRITWPPFAIVQKTRRFEKYLCTNLWKRTPSYSTRPRVKYQYVRQILWIFVESSRAKLFVFSTIYASIFDSRSNNSTSIHQFYYSALTQLLVFTSTTNIKSAPRFADICPPPFARH